MNLKVPVKGGLRYSPEYKPFEGASSRYLLPF